MSFTDPERRRGLHELAASIDCLAAGMEDARVQIAQRFDSQDSQIRALFDWRDKEAAPVLKELHGVKLAALWVGSISTILCAVVVWVFLTTYEQLQKTADLTIDNSKVIAVIVDRMGLKSEGNRK